MNIIRIELEGLTCSFRYPYFHVGRQPTYRMPPPATIYGHICSAIGDWLEPSLLKFGYSFSFRATSQDYEHIYQFEIGSGKVSRSWGQIENIKGDLVPLWRDIIFNPKLILYVDAPGLLDTLYSAFRSPRYPVVLGRSQDLACYRHVDIISLESARMGYYENTLLPWTYRLRTKLGNPAFMPKFVDPYDRAKVIWAPYLVLEDKLFLVEKIESGEEPKANEILSNDTDHPVWVDPDSVDIKSSKRIVVWHDFREGRNDSTGPLRSNTG